MGEKLKLIGYGMLGAFLLDAFGRPPGAKVRLPIVGAAPTILPPNPNPGLFDNLLAGGGLLSPMGV